MRLCECVFILPVKVFRMHQLADEMLNYRVVLNGMGSHYKMVEIPVVALEVMVF